MPHHDIDQYLENLKLAPSPQGLAVLSPQGTFESSGEAAGYVNNRSLISFVANVGGQARTDVLNCTLLAQRAADADFDIATQSQEWYGAYLNVLKEIGWAVQGDEPVEHDLGSTQFEMKNAILSIMTTLVGNAPALVAVLKATLDSLEKLTDDDAKIKLFERTVNNLNSKNFQIGVATETNGAVAMTLSTFELTSSQGGRHVIFFRGDRQTTKLVYHKSTLAFHQDAYDDARDSVREILADSRKDFIGKLKLKLKP